MNCIVVQTPADAAAMIRAVLPKEQKEERVFVLPLDAQGRVLAKPILVAVGTLMELLQLTRARFSGKR